MNQHTTKALICLTDDLGIEYVVSEIEYTIRESEEFEYIFRPNYAVIDLLDASLFQGIPGLDLDKGKDEYVRKNVVPTFISERAPGSNREELWRLLADCDMEYLNQLEWLTRTDTQYGGDRLYVRKTTSSYEASISFDGLKRNADIQKNFLITSAPEGPFLTTVTLLMMQTGPYAISCCSGTVSTRRKLTENTGEEGRSRSTT